MVADVDKLADPGFSEPDSLIGEAQLRVYGDKRTAEMSVMLTGRVRVVFPFKVELWC